MISNRCARKSLVTNCNSIISKNYLRFLVDSNEQKENLIGAQGCIWTEWTKERMKMEWQMMPRIAALAEIQWSKPENKDIQDFLRRLKHQIDIYKFYGYNYKEDIHEALDNK